MKQLNIEQVHAIMLDMAKVFHSLCEKHGVKYYMIGGTQLGAIRHKGFIPWDDDMDFAVPRSDFDRLEKICRNELPEPYKIVECVRGNHVQSYLKIEDVRTSIEDCVSRRFHTRVGINLDIFPLEDCSLDVTKILPYMRKKVFLDRLATMLYANIEKPTVFKKIVQLVFRVFLFWFSPQMWLKKYHKLEKAVNETGHEAMISLSSRYREKEVISKQFWGAPKLYDFENTQFYGPENADGYLKCLFNDYMKLPPEKERAVHCNGYRMEDSAYEKRFI